MLSYKTVQGQSIWDVCLNTYGSFDFLSKLLYDNNIESIDVDPFSGQVFIWDETLTVDQVVNQLSRNSNVIYATKVLPNEIMNTVVSGDTNSIVQGGANIGGGSTSGSGGSSEGTTTPTDLFVYIGAVDDLTPSESTVKSLATVPATKNPHAFKFTVDTKRFCFAYPTFFGPIGSIKDTNGFEIKSGFTTSILPFTIDGQVQSYTILTLSRKTTQTSFTVTFSF